MSGKSTIARHRKSDGKLVRILPDGQDEAFADLPPLPHRTDEQIRAAALADADNPPLTDERLKQLKTVPRVRILRRALRLTQEEFAARFQIPLGTLRDWEQGRTEPDQPARAYLKVIARDPEGVRRALQPRAASSSR
jgi:putative transcriptional regulator